LQRASKVRLAVILAVVIVGFGTFEVWTSTPPARPNADVVRVVAAENFWGSLVAQIGGSHVSVTSLVTDPNADPHEYEANATDARLVSDAQLVIQNGEGYDNWLGQLVNASPSPQRVVLNVQSTLGVAPGGNPHFWYNPAFVNATVHQMYADLVAISPGDTAYFQQENATLNASLGQLYGRATEIRDQFAGTEVASTEDIFVYLANFTHLDLVSPPAFMQAVSEGNDPPAQSVVEFQTQLESGNVSLLVYNAQTQSPITSEMQAIAAQYNVTVVPVTETIQPPGASFQAWMGAEYLSLENALSAKALGR
jgi:zinc/manganese transport system substrate-binding protein